MKEPLADVEEMSAHWAHLAHRQTGKRVGEDVSTSSRLMIIAEMLTSR